MNEFAPACLQNDDWDELRSRYRNAAPFPHLVFDDFLPKAAALALSTEFPQSDGAGWIHYLHYNEHKHGLNRSDCLPAVFQNAFAYFNSTEFTAKLSALTGIPNLLADPDMEGGGLHLTERGGFLNIHADFTAHPRNARWRRRVNLILYLNPDWRPEYKGELEFWSKDMLRREQSIAPIMNRCVVFNTDVKTFHGCPEPLNCPEGEARRSIALYYFTESAEKTPVKPTNYQPRPDGGENRLLMALDQAALTLYARLKRAIGLRDETVGRILRFFAVRKK